MKNQPLTLYDLVRKAPLQMAWRKVRQNGLKSASLTTQNLVKEFDAHSENHILQIRNQLQRRRFAFQQQEGVLVRKASGGNRPIVIAPVTNRIVQRSILEVLQATPSIRSILDTPTSFGGIKGRDRRKAIYHASEAIRGDHRFYIRSDIEGFFNEIPRKTVRDFITQEFHDDDLVELFHNATSIDLANLEDLGDAVDLFPLEDRGVAQGNPLSPLMGNILLREFDRELNSERVICLRYIDDFLLLGPDERSVWRAFRRAQRLLAEYGMRAYNPHTDVGKAAMGVAWKGLTFLGCHVNPAFVEPSPAARSKLLRRVDEVLLKGRQAMRRAAAGDGTGVPWDRYAQTICHLHRMLTGWGHAVSFCDKRGTFASLDAEVDRRLGRFHRFTRRLTHNRSPQIHRRILGVGLLTDIPVVPLSEAAEAAAS